MPAQPEPVGTSRVRIDSPRRKNMILSTASSVDRQPHLQQGVLGERAVQFGRVDRGEVGRGGQIGQLLFEALLGRQPLSGLSG